MVEFGNGRDPTLEKGGTSTRKRSVGDTQQEVSMAKNHAPGVSMAKKMGKLGCYLLQKGTRGQVRARCAKSPNLNPV